MPKTKSEVMYGTLDLIVLKALDTLGAIARIRHGRAHPPGLPGTADRQPGDALRVPGTAGTERLHHVLVGYYGEQAACALLRHHQDRPSAGSRKRPRTGSGWRSSSAACSPEPSSGEGRHARANPIRHWHARRPLPQEGTRRPAARGVAAAHRPPHREARAAVSRRSPAAPHSCPRGHRALRSASRARNAVHRYAVSDPTIAFSLLNPVFVRQRLGTPASDRLAPAAAASGGVSFAAGFRSTAGSRPRRGRRWPASRPRAHGTSLALRIRRFGHSNSTRTVN